MKLSIDFLNGRARAPIRRFWPAIAAVLFAIALAAYLRVHGTVQKLNDELVAAKYELSDARRKEEELARGAVTETTNQRLRAQYRASLPWTEVLDALESIPTMQATGIRFDVDAGEASIEVVAPDNGEVVKAVDDLKRALPRWRVSVVRQDHVDGRVQLSLRLEDDLRPPAERGGQRRN